MASDGKASGLRAPFPYFGGKSTIASLVWYAFGEVKQYIEPFCGSAAVLLSNPRPAGLEVVGDANGYIANFWRATKYQPEAVWRETDYPVSHIDLAARHRWLTSPERTASLAVALADPEWPGEPRIAGWWAWGQCCWIGSGWCERAFGHGPTGTGEDPDVGDAGRGLQAPGQIPHVSDAGRGAQSPPDGELLTPYQGRAREWIMALSRRLARVRVIHGEWTRCLNHHYGAESTAVFLDPPYLSFEKLYAQDGAKPVALEVAKWAAENANLRVAICGHAGDYDGILDGWQVARWKRSRLTYSGASTTDAEAIYFSPACRAVE